MCDSNEQKVSEREQDNVIMSVRMRVCVLEHKNKSEDTSAKS